MNRVKYAAAYNVTLMINKHFKFCCFSVLAYTKIVLLLAYCPVDNNVVPS